MKLSSRELVAFLRRPDPGIGAFLIAGEDGMQVAQRRRELVLALIGAEGDGEMRLTRFAGADLRKEAAALGDALRARGFFAGPRVVLVEEATDGLAPLLADAIADRAGEDARLVVTAGGITTRSALARVFETRRDSVLCILYDEPPADDEIDALLRAEGIASIAPAGRAALSDLAGILSPGEFRQFLARLSLYCHGSPGPVTAADVAAVAPLSAEAELDELLDLVGDRRADAVAPVLRRLWAQGTAPTTVAIGLVRHLRALHQLAAAGPNAAGLRPPAWGPRRDVLARQSRNWTVGQAERALALALETDLAMRSAGQQAPDRARLERAIHRIVHLPAR